MKHILIRTSVLFIGASLFLSACGGAANLIPMLPGTQIQAAPAAAATLPASQPQASTGSLSSSSLGAYEATLEGIYSQVNPAVVSISVVQKQSPAPDSAGGQNSPFSNLPNFLGPPSQNNNPPAGQQFSQVLGSGFVWNQAGYIVTNNHVVNGADTIEVKFSDGTTLPATLVGADPDSDLAVIKVENPGFTLTPVTVSDSSGVKVGQVAVAIGNPFGLENTMTVGIVSALGRSLPAGSNADGLSYSIPDIIQTDASINPGNSGGPLLDDQGGLIGVNTAIESSTKSNSGIGFSIPSNIVSRVVPELIKNGKYEHSFLGVVFTTLTPDLAKAMNLTPTQRGALVEEVSPNGPAEQAGLKGSSQTATINGQDVPVGGDVITAVDGSPVKTIDDVIAYLANHTSVGQKVTLTILRGGKEQSMDVTLQARPLSAAPTQASANAQQGLWLGIAGQPLTPEINKEMNLPANQSGVLVEQVQPGSPADGAGLNGSSKPVILNGQRVLVGGDVITSIDGHAVTSINDLQAFLQTAKPGQKVSLTILRNGQEQTLTATLAVHP
jgi:S1-C subfamily serine protease